MSNTNYTLLLGKLDEFIRKYYVNQLLRGILFTIAICLSTFLLFSYVEYNLFLSTIARKIIFYGFITGTTGLMYLWIINPLLKYYKLGKLIDYKTASQIIGKHFSEVEDRLMNVLQLHEQAENSASKDLIEASINQKIEKIKPVPFTLAIDLYKNQKYSKYVLPPLAIFVFLLFAAPNILKDSSYRFLKNNIAFEKQAPFQFNITNNKLDVLQYEDFELNVKITGEAFPASVSIETNSGMFTMIRKSGNLYSFTFNKVPADIDFTLHANGFNSRKYTLNSIPKPLLVNFSVDLTYPAYTGKKSEQLKNSGDLIVPEGTDIGWLFHTDNTQHIELFFPENKFNAVQKGEQTFNFKRTALQNEFYKIGMANDLIYNSDTIQYQITIIPDAFPQILVQQFTDSLDNKFLYFLGEINDDYGFSKLNFNYKIEGTDKNKELFTREEASVKINFANLGLRNSFTHTYDIRQNNLQPGDRITYYFEVWDNDGINGSKSTRSMPMQYIVPSLEELQQIKDEQNEEIKNSLEDVLSEIEQIRKRAEELENKFIEKKQLTWEDKKQVEDLLKQQQNLQQQVQEIQNQYKENISSQKEFLTADPKLLEKQMQLEQLLEEVLTDEMKKLMEEIQNLMEELNKEQSLEKLEEMDMSNQQLEQELDRMLELFKQMEIDQKIQETADKLKELAEEQEQLSEQTLDKNSDNNQNIDNQEDIKEKFNDIQKDLEKIEELNQELEKSKDFSDTEKSEQEIEQEMQKSTEQMQQNKKKQAAESQKSAAQNMKEMAKNMESQMNQAAMQQQQEDLNSLRRLLDNLITLSVDQEALIYEASTTKTNNPSYIELMNEQQRIKEDTKLVEDSLIALSKRVFQISSFITREISEVNKNLDNSLTAMSERQTPQAAMHQQYTMTGYNNLALMLDEVMQQMQQQMAQSMPGSQMCQKPGGESQLPTMGEMQKQLNEQLKQMQGQMQKGQKPDKQGMSQQLAEMAAKQAAIRETLQKMAEQLGGGNTEDGQLAKQLQEIADKMDKTEEDIVNKQLNEQTLKRQEEILTRLLEAEESDRERKTDNERKSNTAQEINRTPPTEIEEYLKKRNAELDMYKTVSPELKPFYKNLVEQYFSRISFE